MTEIYIEGETENEFTRNLASVTLDWSRITDSWKSVDAVECRSDEVVIDISALPPEIKTLRIKIR
jgi:hypothetical protein